MAWTLAEAQANLQTAKDAYRAALTAANYTYMNGGSSRTVVRQKLETLKAEMMYWDGIVSRLDGTSKGPQRVAIPRDFR